jgi:uncharacterized protein (TIGR03435 family)
VKRQSMSVFATLAIATGCLLSIPLSLAQVPPEKRPLAFEVASVRPGKPIDSGIGLPRPLPGGQGYVATNAPLMAMLMSAYRLPDSQISGATKWMIFDPWDVDAKAEHPSTLAQLQEMFQSLLADRFQLRFHRETKEAAAYVLSVEKSGSKLKISDATDPSDMPVKSGDRPGERIGTGVSMSYLCWYFSFTFDAPLVNQTGLDGLYDFTLKPLLQPQEAQGADTLDRRNADLVTALREQLGLKLEYRKAPVEFFVIDHAERPSEN